MQNSEGGSFFDKLAGLFAGGAAKNAGKQTADNSDKSDKSDKSDQSDKAAGNAATNLNCCSGRVHIAYRGVSDDRLYLAENRTNNEVKFFRPIGLRVFCADCRKRLL